MTVDLDGLDAVGQAALVKAGELSALELVDAAIARIERLEPHVHALAGADFDQARRWARTQPSGALGGVPFLVKDLTPYPGLRYSMGSRLFAQHVASEPTPYTRRLDEAGLIVLAKTTTSELGLLGSTETLLEGITHNPWAPDRSAGGSSGGSAAAVACGMVPMAHASDGGGSIRIPASMNGVFGFKPSPGRLVQTVPDDMGGWIVDHCVSRSVRDSAWLLASTERADHPAGPVGYIDGPTTQRLRIGVYTQTSMGDEPSPAIGQALERTAALCRDLGHVVDQAPPPPVDGPAISAAFFVVAGSKVAQMATMIEPMLGRPVGADELEPFTLALIARAKGLPEGSVEAALQAGEREGAKLRRHLQGYDVMLCPTVPVDLWPLGTLAPTLETDHLIRRTEQLAGYTAIHTMAQVPAMSVPLEQSPEGWPIGMHFAAAQGGEGRLLRLAYELEAAAPWASRYPDPPR